MRFVVVPEDHNDPSGPTIRIAVAILKDQSDEHQPDPVMLLHGGPGEKTMANTIGLAPILTPLHPNRDLIIFDQRGVGSSEPALECPGFEETYFANLEEKDPNIMLQVAFDTWITCRDHLLESGHPPVSLQYDPKCCRCGCYPQRVGLRSGQPVRRFVWLAPGAGCNTRPFRRPSAAQ